MKYVHKVQERQIQDRTVAILVNMQPNLSCFKEHRQFTNTHNSHFYFATLFSLLFYYFGL